MLIMHERLFVKNQWVQHVQLRCVNIPPKCRNPEICFQELVPATFLQLLLDYLTLLKHKAIASPNGGPPNNSVEPLAKAEPCLS